MVWDLPLQADPGGPTPIFYTVRRNRLRLRDTPFMGEFGGLIHTAEGVLDHIQRAPFTPTGGNGNREGGAFPRPRCR